MGHKEESGEHLIKYDDGDEEWLNLSESDCRAESKPRQLGAGGAGGDVGLAVLQGEELVGWRIEVLWPEDFAWFVGLVGGFNLRSRMHLVEYDDGDKRRLDLSQVAFRLVGEGPCVLQPSSHHQPNARSGKAKLCVGAKRGGVAVESVICSRAGDVRQAAQSGQGV